MFDFRLEKRLPGLLSALLHTGPGQITDKPPSASEGNLGENEPSSRRSQPGWTIYVADVDRLLDLARADGRVDNLLRHHD